MRYVSAFTILCVAAFAKDPERIVNKNIITSNSGPAIRIELPKEAVYVGAERWDLYNVADCELHVWVEATPGKAVTRLYWLQFEAFLPTKPDSTYKYPFTRTTEIAGLPFDTRARFGPRSPDARKDSDGAHVEALVQAAGYTLPAESMNVRFVHLLDAQKRSELMFIYAEDLAPTGFKSADLMPGAKSAAEWPKLEAALIERAASKLKLTPH